MGQRLEDVSDWPVAGSWSGDADGRVSERRAAASFSVAAAARIVGGPVVVGL
jgi:hypothetical protein